MKRLQSLLLGLLCSLLPLLAAGGEAALPPGTADLKLNGIVSSLFGINEAFFVLPATGAFSLAEGESKFGIKLIAIEADQKLVRISAGGRETTLHICPTPTLVASAPAYHIGAGEAGLRPRLTRDFASGADASEENLVAAPELPEADRNPILDGNRINNPASTGAGDGNQSGASDSGASGTVRPDWYQDAMVIEQSRAETVNDVQTGRMDPWPRTPLTPAGIAATLVDENVVLFAKGMPGYPGVRPN